MILISASDNNSWRHYRLRALATIRAWTYALRTCSDATLGRETKPGLAQGVDRRFSFLHPRVRLAQEREGIPSSVITPSPPNSRSPAILVRWVFRSRAENVDFAADPSEVGVIG